MEILESNKPNDRNIENSPIIENIDETIWKIHELINSDNIKKEDIDESVSVLEEIKEDTEKTIIRLKSNKSDEVYHEWPGSWLAFMIVSIYDLFKNLKNEDLKLLKSKIQQINTLIKILESKKED